MQINNAQSVKPKKHWRGEEKNERNDTFASRLFIYCRSFNCCPLVRLLLLWVHYNSLLVSLFSTPAHQAYRLRPTMHVYSRLKQNSVPVQVEHKMPCLTNLSRHHYKPSVFNFHSDLCVVCMYTAAAAAAAAALHFLLWSKAPLLLP